MDVWTRDTCALLKIQDADTDSILYTLRNFIFDGKKKIHIPFLTSFWNAINPHFGQVLKWTLRCTTRTGCYSNAILCRLISIEQKIENLKKNNKKQKTVYEYPQTPLSMTIYSLFWPKIPAKSTSRGLILKHFASIFPVNNLPNVLQIVSSHIFVLHMKYKA